MRMLAALLLAALLAVGLAACSGQRPSSTEDFNGEQRNVAEALEDLEDASADEEFQRMCTALLSQRLATQIGKGDIKRCPAEADDAIDDAKSAALDVKKVTIAGTAATVEVEQRDDGDEERVTVGLVKQGGGWRVDDLSKVRVD